MGQTMGGMLFSLLAGQPLIVIMTTAPIALYIKIIVAVAEVSKFHRVDKILVVAEYLKILQNIEMKAVGWSFISKCKSFKHFSGNVF